MLKLSKQEKQIQIDSMVAMINNALTPYKLNETGISNLKKRMIKFNLELLAEAINIGEEAYLKRNENGTITFESASLFLSKLGGIMFNKQQEQNDPQAAEFKEFLSYLKGKFHAKNWQLANSIKEINVMRKSGFTIPMLYRIVRELKSNDIYDLHKKLSDVVFEEEVLNESK